MLHFVPIQFFCPPPYLMCCILLVPTLPSNVSLLPSCHMYSATASASSSLKILSSTLTIPLLVLWSAFIHICVILNILFTNESKHAICLSYFTAPLKQWFSFNAFSWKIKKNPFWFFLVTEKIPLWINFCGVYEPQFLYPSVDWHMGWLHFL